MNPEIQTIQTPRGPARAHRWEPDGAPVGTLVLGHGAGGLSWSADLVLLTEVADQGWRVILVEQPWRVAARKVASSPAHLDEAWLAVLAELDTGARPLVVGGRSAGARVACRTAVAVGADRVLALAFPLHPPGKPEASRAAELALAQARPTLVVQGEKDPFGTPAEVRAAVPGVPVVAVAGAHSFARDPQDVLVAVQDWLSVTSAQG